MDTLAVTASVIYFPNSFELRIDANQASRYSYVCSERNSNRKQRKRKMTIKATVAVGLEFGNSGKMVTEQKVFTSVVEFESFVSLLKDFDAEDELLSVEWDCK